MATIRLIVWLALRGLVARKLSLTLLVIAVAIGVGFQIPNTANLAGSSASLREEWLAWGAGDFRVEPRGRARFADGDEVAARVERAVTGARAVPVIVLAGAVARSRSRFVGVPLVGVDFATARVRVVAGRSLAPGEPGIVLGSAVARRLGATVGDEVELRIVLDSGGGDSGGDGGAYTAIVQGIAGNAAAHESVFVDRTFLAGELQEPGAASAIFVYLPDHEAAPAAAHASETAIPQIRAIDWKTDDPFLPTILHANTVIDRISLAMVIAAIAVPLLALSYISTLLQRRDHAVLRALGFMRRDIFAIQLVQSSAVGCVGSAIGALIGGVAIAVFDRYPIFTWETLVVRPLSTGATFAVPFAVGLVTALLAGVVAAWHAARTDPAGALKRLE
jgi:ABC-type lipoprotein release transport system permease subunit